MSQGSAPLGRVRSRVFALLDRFRYGVSALDQLALSLFGFALNLCLIRELSATDYGAVTLWMTVSLLAIGIQNALIDIPLSTHLPAIQDAERARRLAHGIAVVNLVLIAVAAATAGLVIWLVDAEWSPPNTVAALAVPVFIAAGLWREYYRNIAFSRNDMALLLWIDAPYLAVTSAFLAAMFAWPEQLANLALTFLAISAGSVVGRLFVRRRLSGHEPNLRRGGWWAEYRRIQGDVGWALVGVTTTHLQTRSYVYVSVNLVGLAALAAINAVTLLFRPVRIMATGWGRTALPELAAHLAAGRIAAFDRAIWRAICAACAGSACWFLALWASWGLIERHFLVGHYPDAWLLVPPAALVAALDAMGYAVSIGLRASREFKFLAYAAMVTAPVTIVATVAVVLWHGYIWTMYGVAFGNLVMVAIEGGRLYWVRRRS
jgi:O-antigen/teichoic acid export membrane protein